MLHHPYQRMFRLGSLQNNRTTFIPSPCSSAYLHHQLESTLVSPEIGIVHQVIGIQDSNNTDISEIQPFRQHLRSDKDLRLSFLEVGNDAFVSRTGTRRIEIQPFDLRRREQGSYFLLHLLCPKTHHLQLRTLAFRTMRR